MPVSSRQCTSGLGNIEPIDGRSCVGAVEREVCETDGLQALEGHEARDEVENEDE